MRRRPAPPRYTWLCPTQIDRDRLLNAVALTRRTRAAMFVVIVAVTWSLPADSRVYSLLIALGVAASTAWLYSHLETRRVPEYWAAAGWVMTQTPLAVVIALTGGPRSPAVSWMAIGVVSLVARFSRRAIRVGMAFLFALLTAATVGVDPSTALDDGGRWFLAPCVLLFALWVFAECMMRSDLSNQTTDRVTGLMSASAFNAHTATQLESCGTGAGCCVLLAVDLDGFRLPNDTLGTAAGDDLLRQVAGRLEESLGPGVALARRAADEFLALSYEPASRSSESRSMWDVGVRRAQSMAERIQGAFIAPFSVEGHDDVFLTASIGIAVSGAGSPDAPEATSAGVLLSHAQRALGDSKRLGAGSCVVYRGDDHRGRSRLSILGRLHHAVERDELHLLYQPVVNMHTGEMTGVEALIRWEDPEHGQVLPDSFIPLAEDSGLIVPIGDWVIDAAARQTAEWKARGLNLEVAFNLSPRQLGSTDVTTQVLRALARHSVDVRDVIVEITESWALSDPERTLPLLRGLADRGLRLAIDDFGTGLSSLSRLREIPAHILKIDRSFVRDLNTDPRGESMISVIVELARHFRLVVHAEGVESEHERSTLLRLGCEQAQGFLFARPVPAGEIEAMAGSGGILNGVPLPRHVNSPRAA